MADSMFTFPFGKHKDEDIEDVPTSYLQWLVGEDWFRTQYPKGYKAVLSELKYRKDFDSEEDNEDKNWNRR
ncbi:MAG: DUF3820 family protein [Bacteroidales bacterium]|nr:DUF3820 family protein [Bacteroidales bacterium]